MAQINFSRLIGMPQRLLSMSDLDLRTMVRPLTVFVGGHAPTAESSGRWHADELFSMLDKFSKATLERVETQTDAHFIIEVIATPSDRVTSVFMRESVVVMASGRITAADDLMAWESVATRFATMIDTAAECYAAPSPVAIRG